VRSIFFNGREARLGYLSQLRIQPGYRLRIRKIAEGWRYLEQSRRQDELPFDLASILADNRLALRFFQRGLPGLPKAVPLESLTTLVMPSRQLRRPGPPEGVQIETGHEGRLVEILGCLDRNGRKHQFAPVWTVEDLRSYQRCRDLHMSDFLVALRAGRVVGCLALWDQRSFRQMVIRGYGPWIGWLRPWINLVAPLLGTPRLPPTGQTLPWAFLSHVAVDNDDEQVLVALVGAACREARQRGIEALLVGLATRNPMLGRLRRAFRAQEINSILHAIAFSENGDIVPQLDGRVPHVEIAVL